MIIFLIIILFFLLLLFFPFKLKLSASINSFSVYLYSWRIFQLKYDRLHATTASNINKPPRVLKLRAEYLKLVKYIDFKRNTLVIGGYDFDYAQGATIYGISNGVASNVKNYLNSINIPFEYKTHLIGNFQAEFHSIFRMKMGIIIYQILKIYRRTHGKKSSD